MNESSPDETVDAAQSRPAPQPLTARQRRILGTLMEKARSTPDAYPLSLNGLVTGCNQKSNRHPLMNLTAEQVEDELARMREVGIVAEVHGSGRVPKYRHYGYDYLGVKGDQAAVMIELLLRGEQTIGELRTRASRFAPIADLATLQGMLAELIEHGLVVALTPAGRGQLVTHNLYQPSELDEIRSRAASMASDGGGDARSGDTPASPRTSASQEMRDEVAALREEVADLRILVQQLADRLESFT